MTSEWNLSGQYLESCSCKEACPCVFMGKPTEGNCTALVGWHVDEGHLGSTRLDGLNVVVALDSPGHMADGDWKVVLYVDQTADEHQREALTGIFGGKLGGHPALLAGFIGEVLGMEYLPINFEATDGQRQFKIGKVAETTVGAIEGQDGNLVTLSNHPLAVAPGQTLVVAKSDSLRHEAYGLNFEFNDRMAYYSPFSYTNT